MNIPGSAEHIRDNYATLLCVDIHYFRRASCGIGLLRQGTKKKGPQTVRAPQLPLIAGAKRPFWLRKHTVVVGADIPTLGLAQED